MSVSAANGYACGLRRTGTAVCWGANPHGETDVPSLAFRQVSVNASLGREDACGVRVDGSVTCWGWLGYWNDPDERFRQVSTGQADSACGIQIDYRLRCWGNPSVIDSPPSGVFDEVSAGLAGGCAIRTTGAIVCWGESAAMRPPPGTYRHLSLGYDGLGDYACAINAVDKIECWGFTTAGGILEASARFTQVSASPSEACALEQDGVPFCWPSKSDLPRGHYVEVVDGCGLQSNHTIQCGRRQAGDGYQQFSLGVGWDADGSLMCGIRLDGSVRCFGNGYTSGAPETGIAVATVSE